MLAVFISHGLLAACDDDDDFDRDDDDVALLRVVHAAPGAPAVDVYAEGEATPLVTVAYGEASPYVEVPEGNYRLIVRVSQTDTIVLETDDVNIDEDDRITVIAAGDVSSTDAASSFRVIPLYERFGPDIAGETRVRIVHASPDAPTVDIDVGDDGTIDVATVERFEETGEEGVALPADAALQIGLRSGEERITAFTTPALPSGGELFVIATGFAADVPRDPAALSLLVVGPDGVITQIRQNPTVYALHASPDAPAVDVYTVQGTPVFADLAFGELDLAQVPPGDYSLGFTPAGDPNTNVASAQLTGLAAGERYLAIATGMLTPSGDEQRFQVALFQDLIVPDENARIVAIHASPDAPAVDISTVSGTMLARPPLVSGLEFLEASSRDGLVVPIAPMLPIGIAPANTTTAVATFALDTSGAPRAFVVAAGSLTPAAGEQGFQLLVVNTATQPWSIASVPPSPVGP